MTEQLPLVSIITPAYNRASLLSETIESVLKQDYPNIEYIVLDDGSTDGTRAVMEKYHGRIIAEYHTNIGEQRTVNKGWSMTHGDIIGTVNSDDPLLPGAVSTAVAFFAEHPDIVVTYPDWDVIGPHSEFIWHVQVPEYDYVRMVREHYCMPGVGTFFRRWVWEKAGGRDPDFRYTGDYEFWLRAGLVGKFARIPKTLATWRRHPGAATLSLSGEKMAAEHIRLIEKLYTRTDLPAEVLKVHAEALRQANHVASGICLETGNTKAGMQYYRKSIRRNYKWLVGFWRPLPVLLYRWLIASPNAKRIHKWLIPGFLRPGLNRLVQSVYAGGKKVFDGWVLR